MHSREYITENRELMRENYLFRLNYLTTIAFEGENVLEFLQGQLSCDTRKVNQDTMQQGVLCNLKGRVMALLDVVNWHEPLLVLPEDLCQATMDLLLKPAQFSRIKLKEQRFNIYGFWCQNEADLKPCRLPTMQRGLIAEERLCCYQLDKEMYMILSKDDLSLPFQAVSQYRESGAWHILRLSRLCIEVYPESRGLFLPHELDLQHKGYLSFDKGCYKGQEIIARMHYQSTQKYGLRVFKLPMAEELILGAPLYGQDGKVGEVVDFAPMGSEALVVASVRLDYQGDLVYKR